MSGPGPAVSGPGPALARTRAELRRLREELRGRVALVPTMGALHRGHDALLAAARAAADTVVVSVFVNPLQFGPAEDFERYPRDLAADLPRCAAAGVAVVFAPAVAEMYPAGPPRVTVHAGALGGRWEGASRPGHFDGVLTVVTKLLHLCRPDLAVFGEKDAQQLALVRRLVVDLDLAVEILGVPTVRESDGLAVSSRNRYLDPPSRQAAATLPRALAAGRAAAPAGASAVLAAARAELGREPAVTVDYLALVDEEFGELPADGPVPAGRLLVAARVGGTRLIDNLPLGGSAPPPTAPGEAQG